MNQKLIAAGCVGSSACLRRRARVLGWSARLRSGWPSLRWGRRGARLRGGRARVSRGGCHRIQRGRRGLGGGRGSVLSRRSRRVVRSPGLQRRPGIPTARHRRILNRREIARAPARAVLLRDALQALLAVADEEALPAFPLELLGGAARERDNGERCHRGHGAGDGSREGHMERLARLSRRPRGKIRWADWPAPKFREVSQSH